MTHCRTFLFILSTIGAIYLGFLIRRPVSLLSDSYKCPHCYGTDLCEAVFNERITLRYDTFEDLFNNLFGVKNTYFGEYNGERVVLKKLGHSRELDKVVSSYPATRDQILDRMKGIEGLKTCDRETGELLLKRVEDRFSLEELWTVLQINGEPLILSIFRNEQRWPVPRVLGACGFLVVEQHCGRPLNHFAGFDWRRRAFLALQLAQAAVNFTRSHPDFRLYLTDISPDNVAVDDDFNLYFVDVENVIVKQKLDNGSVHYSRHFEGEEGFVYSEDEVCEHEMSDHNVYATCRLLLSERAPWPMMQNGLLHSPPPHILSKYRRLFVLIEECVDSEGEKNRFHILEDVIELLREAIQ